MENPDNGNLVNLIVTDNEIHEIQIKAALEEAGIRGIVQSFHDQAFDGLAEDKWGHSRVMVFERDYERARDIVENLPVPEGGDDEGGNDEGGSEG